MFSMRLECYKWSLTTAEVVDITLLAAGIHYHSMCICGVWKWACGFPSSSRTSHMTKQKSPSCLATCLHTVANAQAARQRDKTDISVSGGEVWVWDDSIFGFCWCVFVCVCIHTGYYCEWCVYAVFRWCLWIPRLNNTDCLGTVWESFSQLMELILQFCLFIWLADIGIHIWLNICQFSDSLKVRFPKRSNNNCFKDAESIVGMKIMRITCGSLIFVIFVL